MLSVILDALRRQLEADPSRVLDLAEGLLALLKANPDLVRALITLIPKPPSA